MGALAASWQSALLPIASALFVAFLIWKLRPTLARGGGGSLGEGVRRARERIGGAKTARERAVALVEAGDAAGADEAHATSAMGYYLRAMRSDPTWEGPLYALQRLLEASQPTVFEGILWRRLAQAKWQGAEGEPARVAARLLSALYAGKLRDRDRAEALRRLGDLL